MKAAYAAVIGACRKHGKITGMGGVYDEQNAPVYIGMGARLVLSGSDHALLMGALKARTGFLRSIKV
ncbi:hypothetical protein [Elioraea sp.]|uniref:hypothetical protein n=1 Tax=Elioraea sp. TaxID=2185103 RepID=UPI00307D1622